MLGYRPCGSDCVLTLFCYFSHAGPPTLSLQQANYSVVEDVDTSVLVCAILSGSSLQVPVTAMIITSDITATGMFKDIKY